MIWPANLPSTGETSLCLRVEPGEAFEVETFDASNGYFKTRADKAIPRIRPGFDRVPPLANPIAGPIWVEGAERGDALVVVIEEIVVDDYSWIAIGRGAARSANRRAGRNCRAITRPRSSGTRPAPAARPATARCTSTTSAPGRSRRSSARSASPPTAK